MQINLSNLLAAQSSSPPRQAAPAARATAPSDPVGEKPQFEPMLLARIQASPQITVSAPGANGQNPVGQNPSGQNPTGQNPARHTPPGSKIDIKI